MNLSASERESFINQNIYGAFKISIKSLFELARLVYNSRKNECKVIFDKILKLEIPK